MDKSKTTMQEGKAAAPPVPSRAFGPAEDGAHHDRIQAGIAFKEALTARNDAMSVVDKVLKQNADLTVLVERLVFLVAGKE